MLHQRFTTQLRKLARRWHVHGSSLLTDLRPVRTQLIDAHRSNLQDHAHWTSESPQRTMVSLSSWVVIPADHFPSRAHVICPLLFAILMHKTVCSGEVFSLCSRHYDTSSPATALRVGTSTPSAAAQGPHPSQTDQGLAESKTDYFFLSHVGSTLPHGLRRPHI